ncbi:helix-turn-helix transcriptional regulator [Streptomyces sp. S.PNR 29]|uniref:helix-turn-helix domain-containing protein n=1 Tax=Streptomyces sp. S.PNR 29 TaxID=2973805 RepID=UPI0025AF3F43|nr:helix-turn-helix transcriptional regulator [Streptomyces sp. S.PNR 29]MDN0194002.1 helix-turn-helix domain-containing protein [Streptomyces sp. S.PNR 29]
MGRPETHLDPSEGPLQSFAYELRALRRSVGNPSYRELASRANYSGTTLSEAARGLSLPSLDVTLAYVRACEGDPVFWRRKWAETEAALGAANRPAARARSAVAESATSLTPAPHPGYRRASALDDRPAAARLRRTLPALAGIASVAGMVGTAKLVGGNPKTTALTALAGTCIASGFWLGRSLRDA